MVCYSGSPRNVARKPNIGKILAANPPRRPRMTPALCWIATISLAKAAGTHLNGLFPFILFPENERMARVTVEDCVYKGP